MSGAGKYMKAANRMAEAHNLPLLVRRERIVRKEIGGGWERDMAIFTLAMPDRNDPDITVETEVTGHQLRAFVAGLHVALYRLPAGLHWRPVEALEETA